MKWNYRSDGMLDVLQFTKGIRSFGITISDKACHLLFDAMDIDGDKSVNMDEFNEHFGFRVTHWAREQTVLEMMARELISKHKTPMDAFHAFSNQSMKRSLTPMHFRNFKRFFDTHDEILGLRLRGFEWKKLFHIVDDDDDLVIGKSDVLKLVTQYMETGRIQNDGAHQGSLSSSDVFRRVDVNGDGFLEWHEFVQAMELMRPNLTEADIRCDAFLVFSYSWLSALLVVCFPIGNGGTVLMATGLVESRQQHFRN
eukprot:SAG31_NODE_4574_length_3124_cov_3.152397_2_plen_255_part_00